MLLTGLKVDQEYLNLVIGRELSGRQPKGSVKPATAYLLKPVTDYLLEVTRARYPKCSCEQHGLHAGMTLDSLIHFDGCCDNWVCSRLDSLLRMMGH